MNYGEAFLGLCRIVERLRGEGGCPWDREQSPETLRGDLIEETYECIEAIDEKDPLHIREELGDLFLLVTMISCMYDEAGLFSVSAVLEGISEKLVRRHPHVFGKAAADGPGGPGQPLSSGQVLDNWARIKVEEEGRPPKDSVLDDVSRSLPPLDRAFKLQKKAAKTGFDWPDITGVLAKLREELEETEAEIARQGARTAQAAPPAELEAELGDVLFSAVNLCRFLGVEPSLALQRTNVKFSARFRYMEKKLKESGRALGAADMELMDAYWNEAKEAEAGAASGDPR